MLNERNTVTGTAHRVVLALRVIGTHRAIQTIGLVLLLGAFGCLLALLPGSAATSMDRSGEVGSARLAPEQTRSATATVRAADRRASGSAGVRRDADDIIPGGVPAVGQVCQLESGIVWAWWKTCWSIPANASRPVLVQLAAGGVDVALDLVNRDGLTASHELKAGESRYVEVRANDRLELKRSGSFASSPSRLTVTDIRSEFSFTPTPTVGSVCLQESNTSAKPCWALPDDDPNGLAFAVQAHGPYETAVNYVIKNGIDGLAAHGNIPSGKQEALVLRAGDVLSFLPGAGQQLTVVAVQLPRHKVDPDWPAPPQLRDYCPTRVDTSGAGIKCWRLPPGRSATAFAVRATTNQGSLRFFIKNERDGLKATFSIKNGEERALTLRPDDVLRIDTNMPGSELAVVAVQE